MTIRVKAGCLISQETASDWVVVTPTSALLSANLYHRNYLYKSEFQYKNMPEIEPEKPAQGSTKKIVPVVYYEMLAYRLQGFTYREIASMVDYHEDRVRHLFAKGGVLNGLWRDWVTTHRNEVVDNALVELYEELPEIMRVTALVAKSRGPDGTAARKQIQDMLLGDTRRPVTAGTDNSISEEKKAEIRKAFTNFGVLDVAATTVAEAPAEVAQ